MNEVTLREYVDQRFSDSNRAVEAALVAQEKAIIKAENAAEKRFELLNELRGDVATKQQFEAMEKLVADHQTRLDIVQGRDTGLSMGWGKLVGIMGLVSTVLGIFLGAFYLLSR